MPVDLAHASHRTIRDVAERRDARLFSSHESVAGAHASWRNLDDDELRLVADQGRRRGDHLRDDLSRGREIDDVVRHVEHALDVAGEDAVAFGSDFDGMVPCRAGCAT